MCLQHVLGTVGGAVIDNQHYEPLAGQRLSLERLIDAFQGVPRLYVAMMIDRSDF